MGHDMGIDPYDIKVRGPLTWGKLFGHGVPGNGACDILSTDCECHGECIDLGSAMHDLINFKKGKPIQNKKILQWAARRYWEAAFSDKDCPGGICK